MEHKQTVKSAIRKEWGNPPPTSGAPASAIVANTMHNELEPDTNGKDKGESGDYIQMRAVLDHGARAGRIRSCAPWSISDAHDVDQSSKSWRSFLKNSSVVGIVTHWGQEDLTDRVYDHDIAAEKRSADAGETGEKFKVHADNTQAAADAYRQQKSADADAVVDNAKLAATVASFVVPGGAFLLPVASLLGIGYKEQQLGAHYEGENKEWQDFMSTSPGEGPERVSSSTRSRRAQGRDARQRTGCGQGREHGGARRRGRGDRRRGAWARRRQGRGRGEERLLWRRFEKTAASSDALVNARRDRRWRRRSRNDRYGKRRRGHRHWRIRQPARHEPRRILRRGGKGLARQGRPLRGPRATTAHQPGQETPAEPGQRTGEDGARTPSRAGQETSAEPGQRTGEDEPETPHEPAKKPQPSQANEPGKPIPKALASRSTWRRPSEGPHQGSSRKRGTGDELKLVLIKAGATLGVDDAAAFAGILQPLDVDCDELPEERRRAPAASCRGRAA